MRSAKTTAAVMAVLATLSFAGCAVEVETHDGSGTKGHPHLTAVKYEFNMAAAGKPEERPDSMYVIAYRVVDYWKSSMSVSTTNGKGMYDVSDLNVKKAGKNNETFYIKSGSYKFVAFNKNLLEFTYDNVQEYITSDDRSLRLQDISAKYRTYDKNDANLRRAITNWADYNPYTQFIQSDVQPLFHDSIPRRETPDGGSITCKFVPRRLTQDIELNFNVKKVNAEVPFKIDSVRAEISGIPTEINLVTCDFDITKTAKMMFKTEMSDGRGNKIADGEDTYAYRTIRCSRLISVPSIVENNSDLLTSGPGIMQVAIYISAEQPDGTKRERRVQGKINLYNTLKAAKLYKRVDADRKARKSKSKASIFINADIEVDGRTILSSTDGANGLDVWVLTESEDLNFDI